MARYRRRRYYKRKTGRWSANIQAFTGNSVTAPANSSFYSNNILCQNPIQTNTTVSQQYTVKNIEVSYEVDKNGAVGFNSLEDITVYIMYVPQGMTVTETYPFTHPEYIMAYRFLGSPNYENTDVTNPPGRNAVKVKTRMARRLQTGDSVNLLIIGTNNGNSSQQLEFHGLVRWWTKAN